LHLGLEWASDTTEDRDMIKGYYQAQDYFFKTMSFSYICFDDMVAYCTGVRSSSVNPSFVFLPSQNLHQRLTEMAQFYEKYQSPWSVVVPSNIVTDAMVSTLRDYGFLFSEASVAMGCVLNHPAVMQDAAIQCVDNRLEDWMAPLTEAYEGTLEITRAYAAVQAKVLERNAGFHHYALYVKALPVASLTISMHENIARIDNVGTLPAHQKKGYATRLMQYALAEAYRLGARQCFLEASSAGFALYEKLGFKTLFYNHIYECAE